MHGLTKAKAASCFAGDGGFHGYGSEAWAPLLYGTRCEPELQARICERLATDQRRARVLAVHHMSLAERFLQEAEALGELLKESEALTS